MNGVIVVTVVDTGSKALEVLSSLNNKVSEYDFKPTSLLAITNITSIFLFFHISNPIICLFPD